MRLFLLCLPAALFLLSWHFEAAVALTLVPGASLGFLYAFLVMLTAPSKDTKRNAAYYVVGFVVVALVYGLMVYELMRSQHSPWFE